MSKYDITGMSCAACSARVKKAVSEVKGVTECNVNLLTNSMTVEGAARSEDIISAVKKAGYKAEPAVPNGKKNNRYKHDGQQRSFQSAMPSFVQKMLPSRDQFSVAYHGMW